MPARPTGTRTRTRTDVMARSVSARFSSAAATYDRSAPTQWRMAKTLANMLKTVPPPARVLDAGCGTGKLTMLVREAFPSSRIDAIDIAPGAIELASRRFAGDRRISFSTADAATSDFAHRYDLVVSNSSFQWISPLAGLFSNLKRHMGPGSILVFAMMTCGTLYELRNARRAVAPDKPPRADLPSVDNVIRSLKIAGYTVFSRRTESVRRRYSSARSFLKAIHRAGVTGGSLSLAGSKRRAHLLGCSELSALIRYYDSAYKYGSSGVRATYETLYITALPVFPALSSAKTPRPRR